MRRALVGLCAAFAAAVATVMVPPAATAAITPPTYVRTIGGPGHAGVYAWGMATASDGSILTTDYNNYLVRRYSPSGQLLQSFSCRGNGQGCTLQPYSVSVSPVDGAIYVMDFNAQQIEVFNANGTFRKVIDGIGWKYAPRAVVNSTGRIYVVDSHNISPTFPNRVHVLSPDGTQLFDFGTNGTAPGQLGVTRGIAIGPNDEVYLGDVGNRRIDVFDKDGNFLRMFGSGGTGAGKFGGDMRGIVVGGGYVYVVDASQGQIEKFTTAGQYVATIGQPGSDPGQIAGGREITIGHDGNLYLADYTATRIDVFTPSGTWVRTIPDPPQPAPNGGFAMPEGVAVNNANGNVYVSDTFNHRIQQFTNTGTFVRAWGYRDTGDPNAMDYPRGISVDQATGNVWLNNTRSANIKAYTSTGGFIRSFGSQGPADNQFYYARGIHYGSDNRVYVPDSGNLRLKVTDPQGNLIWSVPCGAPALPGNWVLFGCTSVTRDDAGNVYAASPTENKVYKWTSNGTLVWKKGTAGNGNGQVSAPYGVAVRGNRLYVSEQNGNRIDVFDLNFTYQGRFGSRGAGHGQFNQPAQMQIDNAGRIYVCDKNNERIEVFQLR